MALDVGVWGFKPGTSDDVSRVTTVLVTHSQACHKEVEPELGCQRRPDEPASKPPTWGHPARGT